MICADDVGDIDVVNGKEAPKGTAEGANGERKGDGIVAEKDFGIA